jgi:hypothetical protein
MQFMRIVSDWLVLLLSRTGHMICRHLKRQADGPIHAGESEHSMLDSGFFRSANHVCSITASAVATSLVAAAHVTPATHSRASQSPPKRGEVTERKRLGKFLPSFLSANATRAPRNFLSCFASSLSISELISTLLPSLSFAQTTISYFDYLWKLRLSRYFACWQPSLATYVVCREIQAVVFG